MSDLADELYSVARLIVAAKRKSTKSKKTRKSKKKKNKKIPRDDYRQLAWAKTWYTDREAYDKLKKKRKGKKGKPKKKKRPKK